MAERVEDLIGKADAITDAIPTPVSDAVTRYYARHGYELRSFFLISAGTYEATFTKG